jgi:SAM-dependent methyltransferase
MHEILRHLPEGARVLDVGSRNGSFNAAQYPLRTVPLDLDALHQTAAGDFVQADAARLPFPSHVFAAVIANHSLEHFDRLDDAFKELGRVVKPEGSLYIAVPDASTFADRLYRWLASGGGHVNAFRSQEDLIAQTELYTGLQFRAGRVLITSLAMLNRRNRTARAPRKMAFLGGGREGVLRLWSISSRLADRWLHTRLSVYGWALYFGTLTEEIDRRPWSNVCVRCGVGCSSDWLQSSNQVRHRWLLKSYTCPECGARNFFTRDDAYERLC